MKFLSCLIVCFMLYYPIFSSDLSTAKKLFQEEKYDAALEVLSSEIGKGNYQFDLVDLYGVTLFEITELPKMKKSEILAVIDQSGSLLLTIAEKGNYTNPEKARILHRYNSLVAKKSQQLGPFDSLKVLPDIYQLAEKSLQLDPTFTPPYFLMMAVDDGVPVIVGDPSKKGENFKHRIGIYLTKSLEGEAENIYFLVEGAVALLNRNWSAEQKRKTAAKEGFDDMTPQNLSDKEYAKVLLNRAVAIYQKKPAPVRIETDKYNKAVNLLKKL